MKFMLLTILILSIFTVCSAPDTNVLYIQKAEIIKPFEKLIYAVGSVECNFDTLAYNVKEKAAGYFQIRPIRINDYNKRTGSYYTTKDMFDYYIAEKIFLYYACEIGPNNFEKIAKNWNGSGKMTIDYWKKVQKVLQN